MIIRRITLVKGLLFAAVVAIGFPARPAAAQGSSPSYTLPEYNGIQACQVEKDPAARIKCLDDFSAKFPNSTLMPYVYQLLYPAYQQTKNFPKAIEYADRVIALGDKVDAAARLAAIQARCQVFPQAFNPKAADANDQLTKQRDAARQGAALLAKFPKPEGDTQESWDAKVKPALAFFNSSEGFASFQLKDYPAAISAFKTALANKPDDSASAYRLGVSFLQSTPPAQLDGCWWLARAINLKVANEAQVRDYLKKQIIAFEQPGCETSADAQFNELLQLAGTTGERPATYTIPSAADLDKIRQSSNILTVLADLKGGGDKARLTWLAICSAEFPEVVGKVIDVTPGSDSVQLKLFTGSTPEEMQNATTANMDVRVVGQPEASRLQKDDGVRFKGTLVSYDPDPAFMLHWDKAQVNPEDIQAEKGGKHTPHKVPQKSPGKNGNS